LSHREYGEPQPRTVELSSENVLRVAVAGLGRWGANYVSTLRRLPGCELVAGADPDREKRRGQPIPVCDKMDDLLRGVQLDAIVIAAPDRNHYALTRQALLADKHVLVEKPMALNPEHAEELARLASARNRVLAIGHTMVYHDGFRTLQTEVSDGSLGRPVRITAARTSRGSASSTGVLYDLVPHDLAMTIALLGLPLAVRGRAGTGGRALSYQLLYPEDVVMSGWAAWTHGPWVRRFRVSGTLGTAVFSDSVPTEKMDWTALPLTRQCADFIQACRSGTVPCAGATQGVAVARCLAALARSGAGNWVSVDDGDRAAEQSRQTTDGVLV